MLHGIHLVFEILAIVSGSALAVLVVAFTAATVPPPSGPTLLLMLLTGAGLLGALTGLMVLAGVAVALVVVGAVLYYLRDDIGLSDACTRLRVRIFGNHEVGPWPSWRCKYFGKHVFKFSPATGWDRCERCGLNKLSEWDTGDDYDV